MLSKPWGHRLLLFLTTYPVRPFDKKSLSPSNSYRNRAYQIPVLALSSLQQSGIFPGTRRYVEDDSTKRTCQELVDGSFHLNDPTKSQPQWISSEHWGQSGWQKNPKNSPTNDEMPLEAVSILLRTWHRTCQRLQFSLNNTSQTTQGDRLGCCLESGNGHVKYWKPYSTSSVESH